MDHSNTIATKLKSLRKSKHQTQEDVADKIGIKRSTISNYEIGRRMPHIKDLQKLAEHFGVGLDYFGISPKDEVFDLLSRAKEVFESPEVEKEVKEDLYREFMRLYLNLKGE